MVRSGRAGLPWLDRPAATTHGTYKFRAMISIVPFKLITTTTNQPPNTHSTHPLPFPCCFKGKPKTMAIRSSFGRRLAAAASTLLLLPLLSGAAGLYKAGSDVLKLTDANFEVCVVLEGEEGEKEERWAG
jgi:hypothetical protein